MFSKISRRAFLKGGALSAGALALGLWPGPAALAASASAPRVFFSPELSSESLIKVYRHVEQNIRGRVAIKIHSGEAHGPNIIPRPWVRALQAEIPNSALVEANVLYPSPRQSTEGHRELLKINGWTFSPVDILDEDGERSLPISGGRWLKEVAVGKNLLNYDSLLVLTHFKGHAMGGFGGSLKNMAMGCASGQTGKAQIHGFKENGGRWVGGEEFMERLVEAGKAIADYFRPRLAYINILNNLSVSCDCEGSGASPATAPDIGIAASTDLLALEQASVDLVYALAEPQRRDLVERIESRGGLRQLTYMKELGLGRSDYELIRL